MFAVIAPRDLEAAGEAKKVLDGVEMAMQPGPISRLTFGDADDEAAGSLDLTGAPALRPW